MFEISLTNDKKSNFLVQPQLRHGYDPFLHDIFVFTDKHVSINGLKYKNGKDDFKEDKNYLILISGKVFHILKYSENLMPLSAEDILRMYLLKGKGILKELKGNFIILIYNKNNNSFFIAKDQLGLKYLYYKKEQQYFYISSNLNDFKRIPFEYNYTAVLEKILFTYPISNETYIKNVWTLEQGGLLEYTDSELLNEVYFGIEELFNNDNGLNSFNQKLFIELFQKSVIQRANVSEKNNVSLTGGFDGRTNVAVLLKNNRTFRAYSFGKNGGENTSIPKHISEKLGLNYFPVYLDDEFEKEYIENALDCIFFSDGISNFERANYVFALKQIAEYSSYNITGLIGGEIFGAVHLKKDYINNLYFEWIYDDKRLNIKEVLLEEAFNDCFNRDFLEKNKILEKIVENIDIRKNIVKIWKNQQFPWMYYLKDLMNLGFQRFYGTQMHLERYYCENLTTFYDFDIINYLFSTDYINIYRNAFKNSPWFRKNNRKLQSALIKNSFSKIGEIPLDRGYPPNYNLDWRKIFIPYIFYKRNKKIQNMKPDFTSPEWCNIFFKEWVNKINIKNEDIFNIYEINKRIHDYNTLKYNENFNHLLSIAIWLET